MTYTSWKSSWDLRVVCSIADDRFLVEFIERKSLRHH